MKNTKTNRHIDNLKVTVVGFTKHETPRRAVVFLLTMKADPVASADSWRRTDKAVFNLQRFGASNLCCHKILGPLMAKTKDEVWWIPSGDRKHTLCKARALNPFNSSSVHLDEIYNWWIWKQHVFRLDQYWSPGSCYNLFLLMLLKIYCFLQKKMLAIGRQTTNVLN